MPRTLIVNFQLPFLSFLLNVPSFVSNRECPSPVFRSQRWSAANSSDNIPHQPTPFHFYALTQDCQFLIARPDQLNKLSSFPVSPHSRECHPSRVQFHWSLTSTKPSLLLLQKRSAHELCLLPVEMPTPLAVYGPELFSYSLRSALSQFAKCSRLDPPNSSSRSQSVDPQLVFPDSLYSDLFYQLSSSPSYSNWTLHQFQISPRGHLHFLDQFRVQQMVKERRNKEDLLLAIDPQRKRLFAVPKDVANAEIEWTCPFDLIFRADQAKFHRFPMFPIDSKSSESPPSLVSGFSVDRHVAIFTMESTKGTELFLAKLDQNGNGGPETRCVLRIPFAAKFGVISGQTLKELTARGPLPTMGEKIRSARPAESTEKQFPPTKAPSMTPIWHKYTKARMSSSLRQTVKSGGSTQYFWHRSTAMPTSTERAESKPKTTSAEKMQADEAVEGWSEDYEEDRGAEEGEGDDVEGGKNEDGMAEEAGERILPLPDGEETEPKPTSAQMVRQEEEEADGKESGQKSSGQRTELAPLVALALWLAAIMWG